MGPQYSTAPKRTLKGALNLENDPPKQKALSSCWWVFSSRQGLKRNVGPRPKFKMGKACYTAGAPNAKIHPPDAEPRPSLGHRVPALLLQFVGSWWALQFWELQQRAHVCLRKNIANVQLE